MGDHDDSYKKMSHHDIKVHVSKFLSSVCLMKNEGNLNLAEINQYTIMDFEMDDLFIKEFTTSTRIRKGKFFKDLVKKYHVSDWVRQINMFEEILDYIQQIELACSDYL